ncbi:MAG: isopeptide-forming domain-containing fimbrial protein, partial [Acidobacteria bacterium]|nr:isopeptide-forming domain-containing fimbrial protein [Acidobacteriota bacterium]
MRNLFPMGIFVWSLSVLGQVPTLNGVGNVDAFAGEQACFQVQFQNVGSPGFGPYIRMIFPPELTFDSSSFLGSSLNVINVGVFPAAPGNQLVDPFSNTLVTGPAGSSFRLLELPFVSVVAGGPPLAIDLCFTSSTSVPIGVPIPVDLQPVYRYGDTATGINGPIVGVNQMQTITPILYILTKQNNAPEGERPPGPDWPITFTLNVDIANGKTLNNIVLSDLLAADYQYIPGSVMVTGGVGGLVNSLPTPGPGGTLQVSFTSATGTTASNDVVVTYQTYIVDVLDETNCGTQLETNTVNMTADFMASPLPIDSADSMVTAKHIALQKGASGGGIPGDSVTFTLNFQVTDFGTASSYVITDLMPDGLTFGSHLSMTINAGPVAIVPSVTANMDGTTTIIYDVTAVTGNLGPGTGGTITYNATIDQDYTPAPDPVLANDSLFNTVDSRYDLTAGASNCSEGSGASVPIIPVDISKTLVNPLSEYVPGDVVTYRLSLGIPSGDTEGIVFEDFFPLPVFDVTTLNTTFGVDINYAPTDTLGLVPSMITVDGPTNSLRIEWPNISTMSPETLAVDIVITVNNNPFADNLFLTNLFQASTVNSNPETTIGVAPVQIHVRAPSLVITKGVSASDNPTANATVTPTTPVDSDISNSDSGDTVTFVITVENIGGAQAYNVSISDPPPAGFTNCMLTSITDGNGSPLMIASGDLFNTPLVLTDPLAANGGVGPPFGADTAIITYTCQLAASVQPGQVINNEASVTWTSESGAVAFPAVMDDANVTMAQPSINKTVTAIAPGYAGNLTQVQIGEVVTYQVVITVPEGESQNVSFTDLLDNGLAFTDIVSITPSSGDLTTDVAGGFPAVLAAAVFSNQGAGSHQLDRRATLNFGNITNANTVDATAETITIVYRARVLNWTGNTRGGGRNNNASWTWDNPAGGTLSVSDSAPNVTIIEPTLQIVKDVSPAAADGGDTLTITLDIS